MNKAEAKAIVERIQTGYKTGLFDDIERNRNPNSLYGRLIEELVEDFPDESHDQIFDRFMNEVVSEYRNTGKSPLFDEMMLPIFNRLSAN